MKAKVSVGLYLPKQIVQGIDEKRGRISRSTYITILLESVLNGKPFPAIPIVNRDKERRE